LLIQIMKHMHRIDKKPLKNLQHDTVWSIGPIFVEPFGLNVLNLSKSAADFFEHVAWCVETAHWWTAVSTRTQGRERLWYNNNARL